MQELKLAREKAGITQSELARMLNTTQQTIARWESGKSEPNLASLRDLAVCLHTTVDKLLGRTPALEHQTVNPFSWISGDKSGYWGNVGIRFQNRKFSKWYPITTKEMEDVFTKIQNTETNSWILFQTLNNKMVIFQPKQIKMFTFLDEAEDQIEGDWDVGPGDIEGWPQETYHCLDYLTFEQSDNAHDSADFSESLISNAQAIIDKYNLDEEKIMSMCVKTRVVYTDGTDVLLHTSSKRLAEAMFDLDIGIENTGSSMLHLDDGCGDHSVFISTDLISCVELPLIELEKGIKDQLSEIRSPEESS